MRRSRSQERARRNGETAPRPSSLIARELSPRQRQDLRRHSVRWLGQTWRFSGRPRYARTRASCNSALSTPSPSRLKSHASQAQSLAPFAENLQLLDGFLEFVQSGEGGFLFPNRGRVQGLHLLQGLQHFFRVARGRRSKRQGRGGDLRQRSPRLEQSRGLRFDSAQPDHSEGENRDDVSLDHPSDLPGSNRFVRPGPLRLMR